MSNELKASTAIGISLFLFSILVGTVLYFSQVGYSLLSIGEDRRAFKKELAEQRELSHYEDRYMTRDDVLIAVKKYTKEYDVLIQERLSSNDTNPSRGMTCDFSGMFRDICLYESTDISAWDINNLSEQMRTRTEATHIANNKEIIYHSKIERDKDTGMVKFLTFTLQP